MKGKLVIHLKTAVLPEKLDQVDDLLYIHACMYLGPARKQRLSILTITSFQKT